MLKIQNIFFILLLNTLPNGITAQTIPVQHFSLSKENTQIPSDSLGTTYFYSLSFESVTIDTLVSACFKLRGLTTDSLFSTQTFVLPKIDGVYQTGYFANGLIKDKRNFYILLGNIKCNEPLYLLTDFIDSKNKAYSDILTNE